MKYIVVEDFNGAISLVYDSTGEVKVFDSLKEAKREASLLQNGLVFPLYNLDRFFTDLKKFIGEAKWHLGDCFDVDNVEAQLDKILNK